MRNFPSSIIASNDDAVRESFFSRTVASRICIAKLSSRKINENALSMKIKRDMVSRKIEIMLYSSRNTHLVQAFEYIFPLQNEEILSKRDFLDKIMK